jgi:hypothetical protein
LVLETGRWRGGEADLAVLFGVGREAQGVSSLGKFGGIRSMMGRESASAGGGAAFFGLSRSPARGTAAG